MHSNSSMRLKKTKQKTGVNTLANWPGIPDVLLLDPDLFLS